MSKRRNNALERVEQVAVGHANPDFDAYAATVAATKVFAGAKGVFLGTQNANVREFHNLHQDFLEFVDLRSLDMSTVRRLIMVDTRDPGRIGELGVLVGRPDVEVVVYDHHPPMEGDVRDADDRSVETGATTSVLTHEIRARGIPLTPLEASVLLLGIHEDTGSLTYPGATAYDGEAAAFLMAAGADVEVLTQFLTRTLTDSQRALLDALVGSLETWNVHGQDVAVGVAQLAEYVDSASVVTHYLAEDLGYRVVVAVVEMPDRLYLVGRSRLAEVDIGAVLGHLGGGGHAQAASAARRDLTPRTALPLLRKALEAEVRPPLTALDVASHPVHTVDPDATMREAADIMLRWGHGGLPVVDGDELVGIVTRKDVDKAVRHGLEHAPVKGFMGREPYTVPPETTLTDLERLLAREGIGRVPVVDGGDLVGIVTRKDVLRAEHGDAYLDRRVPAVRTQASKRFLASVEGLLPDPVRDALHMLGELADERGIRAHVVGGFVRDMLLGRRNLDVDVVVEGDGVAFAAEAGERLGARVKAHRRFGTAVLVLSRDLHVDVASARTEYYARPGALPTVERSSLRQDLLRRDFSVNAMAACLNPECFGAIADPFGGLRDLEQGVIRVLHSLSFVEDPTRVLRAARFEERYGFTVDASTEALARQAVAMQMLDEVSGARVREELLDILAEEHAAPVVRRLADLDALPQVLPHHADPACVRQEFPAVERALARFGPRLPQAPRRAETLLLPLTGRAPGNEVDRWVRRLRLGRELSAPVQFWAARGEALARVLADRRGMRDSRLHALLEPVPPECLVYLWARGRKLSRERVERFAEVLERIRPEVSGDDLIAMGAPPSAAFSAILRQARADRLDGKAVGREAELQNLRRLAIRDGLLKT